MGRFSTALVIMPRIYPIAAAKQLLVVEIRLITGAGTSTFPLRNWDSWGRGCACAKAKEERGKKPCKIIIKITIIIKLAELTKKFR